MKKLSTFFLLFGLLTGCSSPTRIYYWQKANTGADRFIKDHNVCLEKADYWPFRFTNPYPMSSDTLDLRLNLTNGGIWANYSPYPGAMPVFVNTARPSKTMIYWRYSWCMKSYGYSERRPYGSSL